MKKFNKKITVGTKLKYNGDWVSVKKINELRTLIEINEYSGSFQKWHFTEYTNK